MYIIFRKSGFSLIEVVIGTAIFLIVALAVYGAFTSLTQLANGSQSRTLAVELADEQFEIIRNLPYTNVGLSNGIPQGVLPQTQTVTRGGMNFIVTLTVRNINLSTSTLQASDRLVEVNVDCPACQDFQPIDLTGQVSPANLQSAGNGGALSIQVNDAFGRPVEGATVNVQSVATSSVQDTDLTDKNGVLQIIGVPQGANTYRIVVTKTGYSTDRTYPIGGAGNPNPTKPDATVLNQQVTNVSFAIDRLSSLTIAGVSPLCAPVNGIHFSLVGTKTIGTGVLKFPSLNLVTAGSSASWSSSTMEWDTYTITPTDASYDLEGINPLSPFNLNPNNIQNVQLVMVPKSGNSLMVTVEDNAKIPISGATVELQKTGYDVSQTTGQGYMSQTDWSGGGGQANFSLPNQYFAGFGVDTSTSTGNILLAQTFGQYTPNATATLESSTFDTGTSSNFYTFNWTPLSQPPLAGASSVKFQFASSPTAAPSSWTYVGPDGTPNSYFSVPGSSINLVNNGNEFARYMAYLNTNTATVTPMISNVSFSYTSGCIPPGQVIFQGLSTGSYTLTVSKTGYAPYSTSVTVASGWQQQTVQLAP
jgi:prepilin-type N-terminal cleavage/methylation domain-containing protein